MCQSGAAGVASVLLMLLLLLLFFVLPLRPFLPFFLERWRSFIVSSGVAASARPEEEVDPRLTKANVVASTIVKARMMMMVMLVS